MFVAQVRIYMLEWNSNQSKPPHSHAPEHTPRSALLPPFARRPPVQVCKAGPTAYRAGLRCSLSVCSHKRAQMTIVGVSIRPVPCPRPVPALICVRVPPHQFLRVRGTESKPAGRLGVSQRSENTASPSHGAQNHCP